MVPTPADIARYRHIASAIVRGVGLLLLLYSVPRLGMWVWSNFDQLAGVVSGGSAVPRWGFERLISGVALQAVLFAFGVVSVLRPGWVARWLVPARARAACPGCGFNLSGLRSETCPECGLVLGAEFVEAGGGGPIGEGSKAGGSDSEEGPGRP